MAITAEPTPSRISSLAIGTDIDAMYHIALYELEEAIEQLDGDDGSLSEAAAAAFQR